MAQTRDMIRSFIAEELLFSGGGFPHSDEASFLDEGIIDSMNILQLVLFVEQKFGLSVKDEDIVPEHFDSVSKVAAFVESKTLVHA